MSDKSKKFEIATDTELMHLFTGLTNFSGQKFSSEEDVNICYMNFIPLFKNSFGKYTLEEIRLAYQYAREGKFTNEKGEQFRLYRELNYASACDVMLEYEEFKKDKLGAFIQNQTLFLTEKTKEPFNQIDAVTEFLTESWKITNRNEVDTNRGSFLYDYFKDLGLINLSKEEKTEIQQLALDLFKSDKEKEKTLLGADLQGLRAITRLVSNIQSNDAEIVIYSKRIAFGYQIRNWQMEGLEIENIKQLLVEYEAKISNVS